MTSSTSEITLLAPGLLGPQAVYPTLQKHERADLPVLQSLLSHADVGTEAETDWLYLLFKLLGFTSEKNLDLPIASICAAVDGISETHGWWLRVDPVYVQIDRDRAVMLASDELAVKQDEANDIVSVFNEHYAQDGIEFIAQHPQRWYLRITNEQYTAIKTTPLNTVLEQNINDHLPTGEHHKHWHCLLNELQMLLYNHTVNQQRDIEGRVNVNSVWLWGSGPLPRVPQQKWDHIYTDTPLVEMLANFCQISCSPLSQLNLENVRGRILIVMPECATAALSQDVFAWLKQLQYWEKTLFNHLLAKIKQQKDMRLSLLSGDGRSFTVTNRAMHRWWRRKRPFNVFLTPSS